MIRRLLLSPLAISILIVIVMFAAWGLLNPSVDTPNVAPPKWPAMSPIADDQDKTLSTDDQTRPQRSSTVSRMKRRQFPPSRPPQPPQPPTHQAPTPTAKTIPKPPIIHYQREETSPASPPPASTSPALSQVQETPAIQDDPLIGEIIRCQLLSGLISGHDGMPILAIVTDDVITRQGVLILPRGAELQGDAQSNRTQDRIHAASEWLAIWPNGKKQRIEGITLHHDQDPITRAYGAQDMTPGIKGTLKDTDSLRDYKQLVAAALSAASRATQDTTRSLLGNYRNQNLGNLARDGVDSVADRYLRRLETQIKGDGKIVTVPAGTRFYLAVRPSKGFGTQTSANLNAPSAPTPPTP